jgi:4-diphosphocytidyl-2-C-methyl-D-erythritol kinase
MRTLSVLAPAKLNLFLHVGGKRPDKYHALESLVVFAETGDRLELSSVDGLSLKVSGPYAAQTPKGDDNLVLKAAKALAATMKLAPGVSIALEKNLPVAAGIGGGSADAAAALRGLNVFWNLNRAEAELIDLAATLGSDVPACLLSRPCWMEGRGEHVKRVPAVPRIAAVLVNPGVELPTKDVFAALNLRKGIGAIAPPETGMQTLWDLVAYLGDAENDLEAPACRLRPVIDGVLGALNQEPGCVMSLMSGSGATCFGLFEEQLSADLAADKIAQDHPQWWVKATRIAGVDAGMPRWKGE